MSEVINIHYDRSDNFEDVRITFKFPLDIDTSSIVCVFKLQGVKWTFDQITDHKVTVIITKDIVRKLCPGYCKGILQFLDGPRGYQNTFTQDFNIDRRVPSSPDQIINVECPNFYDFVSDKFFAFEQGVASDRWEINHKLNKFPSVTVVDTANNIVDGSVEYIDEDNIIINFNGAFKGNAYLN